MVLKPPLDEDIVRGLRVGDKVSVTGRVFSARDRVHKLLVLERPEIPFSLEGGIIYHCGPVVKKAGEGYTVVAAGPTTSSRLEMYEADLIRNYGIRAIIGKGGMGDKTRQALRECGCVYLHPVSGAAVFLCDRIKQVIDVWKVEEFGQAEAMWVFEVEDFPAIVTMDSRGNSLHEEIQRVSIERAK